MMTDVLSVPQILIYEMHVGKPIYYRGYREVLAKKLSPDTIMGSSILQSWIISNLFTFIT
ncbi:MAG: hypothetical protein H7Y04_15590 [Verrucomicrobia bacterium]|nr:hypothetical protein [Cytophagales bacterium]